MVDNNSLEHIDYLLYDIHTISESYDRIAEFTGERFNIFSILQMETDEVNTHSRFLAELLNPKGSHGQKAKFLALFIASFVPESNLNTEIAQVYVEYHIGKVEADFGGRIDILIKDNSNNVIMIENKIYAGEQFGQLSRYQNKFPHGHLIFLTLYGTESQNPPKKNYQQLSYEHSIVDWLEKCRREVIDNPIVRETIQQYIYLVKKITNQNLNANMSKDILSRVLRDQQSFQAYTVLANTKADVVKSILEQDLLPLLDSVKNDNRLTLMIEKKAFLEPSTKWKSFSFSNELLEKSNILISFSFNVGAGYRNLIFGFSYMNTSLRQNYDYSALSELFKTTFGMRNPTPGWPCFRSYDTFGDWENLTTLKEVRFGSFKQDFAAKVKIMMDLVLSLHNEKTNV